MSSVISSTLGLLGIYPHYFLAALFLTVVSFRQLKKGSDGNPNGLPLPPGPKGYPLIGNLFDVPKDKPWVVYDKWRKTYGDIIYLNVLGQRFVILNSLEGVSDLFEKRSTNYSDRKQATMMLELMGLSISMSRMPYGLSWRRHRKSFHEYFHSNVVTKYLPIQNQATREFLRRLLVRPDDFLEHIRHTFAATIMKIGYGISVQENNDPYISIAEEVLQGAAQAGIPGTFLVDLIPILKHVPSWFPGVTFKKKAARVKEFIRLMAEKPFNHVQEQMNNGKFTPSVAADLIERLPEVGDAQRPMEERIAKNVVWVAYAAGADTTVSSVQTLILALALYPEVQKKAQAEIDAVVGPNRLPDFHDRPSLPYINAIVKESMRWNVVVPFAIPHMSTFDDEYKGYHIPKGSIVMGNSWSILHDPKYFKNPDEFQPERFLKDGKLNPDVRDPDCAAFGYGRRICPGRHLSDNSLYSIASCLLAVFNVKPPVDDQGNTIKLKPDFTSGFLTYPVPYKCSITPRSPESEALIRDAVTGIEED